MNVLGFWFEIEMGNIVGLWKRIRIIFATGNSNEFLSTQSTLKIYKNIDIFFAPHLVWNFPSIFLSLLIFSAVSFLAISLVSHTHTLSHTHSLSLLDTHKNLFTISSLPLPTNPQPQPPPPQPPPPPKNWA